MQEEGNKAVIQALQQAGVLLKQERYQHKYPYDWRTKKPTIFRATDQVGLSLQCWLYHASLEWQLCLMK